MSIKTRPVKIVYGDKTKSLLVMQYSEKVERKDYQVSE